MMTLEERRKAALVTANEARQARATIRKNIAHLNRLEGIGLVAAMLEYPSGWIPSMKVSQLLGAIHQWGRSGDGPGGAAGLTDRLLAELGVGRADKRVGDLTQRQRLALSARLREIGARS